MSNQSESRMYSEDEVEELLYHAVIQGCDHWDEQGCTQRFSAEYIVEKFKQSIQPKTEEVTSVLSWGNNGELLSTPKEQPKMEECETCNALGSPCYFHEPKEQPTSTSIEKINWSPHEILKEIEHDKQMSGQANNHFDELEKMIEEGGTYISISGKEWIRKDLVVNKIQELKTKP